MEGAWEWSGFTGVCFGESLCAWVVDGGWWIGLIRFIED